VLFSTGTYSASATVLSKVFDIANATLYDFQPAGGVLWSITFEPLPSIITKYGDLKGGNSLGTSPKDGNAIILLVSALSTNAASNSAIEKMARTMFTRINTAMKAMGTLHTFEYLNYADASQDPIRSYGPANVQRLKQASKRYDPKGVFQKQVPGGFKLGAI